MFKEEVIHFEWIIIVVDLKPYPGLAKGYTKEEIKRQINTHHYRYPKKQSGTATAARSFKLAKEGLLMAKIDRSTVSLNTYRREFTIDT